MSVCSSVGVPVAGSDAAGSDDGSVVAGWDTASDAAGSAGSAASPEEMGSHAANASNVTMTR